MCLFVVSLQPNQIFSITILSTSNTLVVHGRIQRGGGGGGGGVGTGVADPPPPENHQNIGFPSNIDPDSLKNHKAAKPVSIKWWAILMAFGWPADDGPLVVIFGSSLPSSTEKTTKNPSKLDPL